MLCHRTIFYEVSGDAVIGELFDGLSPLFSDNAGVSKTDVATKSLILQVETSDGGIISASFLHEMGDKDSKK